MLSSHLRLAGLLLVFGTVAFWSGAATPPYRWWRPIPVAEYLALVAAHRGAWLWIAVTFAIGVISTLAGLAVLGAVLDDPRSRVWSSLGQTLFLAGGTLWLASIAFRATATVAAANEMAASGILPGWFEPMRAWAGAVFAIYMVVAYLGTAAWGQALRATPWTPRWLSQTFIVFGLIGALGFLARVPVFAPPLLIHLLPGMLGVRLLLKGGLP